MAGNGFPRVSRHGHQGSQVGRHLPKMAGNGFPRVSRHGHRGSQVGNGRKWLKMAKKDFRGYMVGNGFPRLLHHGHRGSQAGNGRKWPKMAENGRKWISAGKWWKMDFRVFCAIPLLLSLLWISFINIEGIQKFY